MTLQQPARSELIADGTVHVIGIVASIVASAALLSHVSMTGQMGLITGVAIYALALVGSFVVSAIYNLWPWQRCLVALKRTDHAAIFLKIAGTYTPLVLLIGTMFGYVVLGVVWTIAICAALGKLVFEDWPRKLSLALYLSLGWAALLLLIPMIERFSGAQLTLIALGGAIYSLGTIFYVWDGLRYQTAIWHGFVLIASGCFFAAISLAI